MKRIAHRLLHVLMVVALVATPVQLALAVSGSTGEAVMTHDGAMHGTADVVRGNGADQPAHDCDCCPPGACHSASAKCSSGQCGTCTVSAVAPTPGHLAGLPTGRIAFTGLIQSSLGPESLYRPPRS